MRIASVAHGASLVVSVMGACNIKRNPGYECLTRQDAQQTADNFQNLISEYSDAIADASTTADYAYYSDSIIELINSGCSTPAMVSFDGAFLAPISTTTDLLLCAAWDCHLRLSRRAEDWPVKSTDRPISNTEDVAQLYGGLRALDDGFVSGASQRLDGD